MLWLLLLAARKPRCKRGYRSGKPSVRDHGTRDGHLIKKNYILRTLNGKVWMWLGVVSMMVLVGCPCFVQALYPQKGPGFAQLHLCIALGFTWTKSGLGYIQFSV